MRSQAASSYDFWLLDLDGTLVDVEESYIHDVCTEVGDRLGVSFTGQQAEHLWYGLGDTRDQVLSATDVDPGTFWETFHRVDSPTDRAAATHIYPDAERFLQGLDSPVGVVTHCQPSLTYPILSHLDIGNWFDTVVCCSDETGWKPDPGPLEVAMDDLGMATPSYRGAMVGDDPGDLGAARNAGLDAIHVDRHDPARFDGSMDGDHHVSELTDLLQA